MGHPLTGRHRLRYIDGLRGLAALAIVVHHTHLRLIEAARASGRLIQSPLFTMPAHCVVSVFVVLSGYSLMIPVLRSHDYQLADGLSGYAWRRARRILPPYYAALAFSLLPLLPGWIGWPRLPWQNGAPIDLTVPSMVAHLLLIQNLRPDWARQLNAPLWSIASECQLYVFFPLMLLPIWRRFGSLATVVAGLLAGIILGKVVGWRGDACPWYLGLFAMGMAGASISSGPGEETVWLSACISAAAIGAAGNLLNHSLPFIDAVAGFASMAMLIYCSRSDSAIVRVLECRPMVFVGIISYSLYLIHQPVVTITATVLTWACGRNDYLSLWLIGTIAIPLSLLAAVVFHFLFERPFMAWHPKSENATAISAATEPAI